MQGKIAIFLGLIVLSSAVHVDEVRVLFESWKIQNEKFYLTEEENEHRFTIFSANYKRISEWNANPQDTFVMGINQFADLTGEEFKAAFTGYGVEGQVNCPSSANFTCPQYPTNGTLNETVDWNANGAVTPVKNQGQCGSCWTFSTTGCLEGLNYLNTGKLLSFSEQQIVDCDVTKDTQGCDGGFPYLALDYTAKNGIELETEYPYTAANGKCKYNSSEAHQVNNGWNCVGPKDAQQLALAVNQQPVSIAVQANEVSWQFYLGGVINFLCGDALDHAVLLVGYGKHWDQDAWYVKNSWGATWGDHGYLWISQDAKANDGNGVCGILSCAVVPTTLNA